MAVSVEQISALLDFLEGNQELAFGYCNRSKEGRCKAKRLWEQCAAILNSISPNCIQKSSDQWRVYYNEYKSKLLKKISTVKAGITGTGGGPSKNIVFTTCQERLRNILGKDIGEPLEGVRHNPLSESYEVIQEIMIEHNEHVGSLDNVISESQNDENEFINDRENEPAPAQNPESVLAVESAGPTDPAAPRRRRRRRQISPRHQPSNDPAMHMNLATERLEAIEQLSVEAIREHAQAIHRLAAAFERLADQMGEPLRGEPLNPPQPKRCRRVICSSDSDVE